MSNVRTMATIETGMNDGGIAWIGGVRVAEMKLKAGDANVKDFDEDAMKIKE